MTASRKQKEKAEEDRQRALEEKIKFLALVEANIRHLEGKLDNSHTRETRIDKWRSIAASVISNEWRSLWGRMTDKEIELAKSGDTKATDKLVAYLRDSGWGDLKKRYREKIDQYAKTGSGGGSQSKLDDLDKLVERILGSGSKASVDGLEVSSDGIPADAIDLDDALHPIVEAEESTAAPTLPLKPSKRQRMAPTTRSLNDAKVSLKASQEDYVKQKTEYYRLLCEKMKLDLELFYTKE
ncbi:hypothetical protein FOL47_001611 [Perkinsus chesapeaki]|uniref:Regulatory protein zeste n=1 Tax=Perkinsus chesapeaki TaxID=330153 RepID=A0A7J6KTF1_PERCH|nr:hypothetical protein FOL47_001611 [Perkinsus chesapeaki]